MCGPPSPLSFLHDKRHLRGPRRSPLGILWCCPAHDTRKEGHACAVEGDGGQPLRSSHRIQKKRGGGNRRGAGASSMPLDSPAPPPLINTVAPRACAALTVVRDSSVASPLLGGALEACGVPWLCRPAPANGLGSSRVRRPLWRRRQTVLACAVRWRAGSGGRAHHGAGQASSAPRGGPPARNALRSVGHCLGGPRRATRRRRRLTPPAAAQQVQQSCRAALPGAGVSPRPCSTTDGADECRDKSG